MNSSLAFLLDEHVASIRDIQKNPSKALRHITRVTRGSKTLGFFISEEEMEDLVETLEALSSKPFRARMKRARQEIKKGKTIPFEKIARQYGL